MVTKAVLIVSVMWCVVYWLQTSILFLFFSDTSSRWFMLVFFTVYITSVYMENVRQAYDDGDVKMFLTWPIRFVFSIWLIPIRIFFFTIALPTYFAFAVMKRIVGTRSDYFTSILFSLVQIESGIIRIEKIKEEKEMYAHEAERQSQLKYAYRSVVENSQRQQMYTDFIMKLARENNWTITQAEEFVETAKSTQNLSIQEQLKQYGINDADLETEGFVTSLPFLPDGGENEWVETYLQNNGYN